MSKINAPPPGFRLLHSLDGEGVCFGRLRWSPAGRRIAAGASDETIRVWDAQTGQFLRRIMSDSKSLVAFAWMGDSTILTWSSDQPALRSHSVLGSRSRNKKLEGFAGAILALDCSPDTQMIAGVTDDQKIRVWEAKTGRLIRAIEETWEAREVVWSPRGGQLALRDDQGCYWLRDAETGERLTVFSAPPDTLVRAFSWSPDAKHIARGIGRGVVVQSVDTSRVLHRLVGHSNRIKAISFSTDGSLLASKSYDGTVRVWRCDLGKEVAVLDEPTSDKKWPPSVAFHPRDPLLATLGNDDKVVRLWRLDLLSQGAERERRLLKAAERQDQRLSALDWDVRDWVITNSSKLANEQAQWHLFAGFLQRYLMMSASRERIFNETHNRGNLLYPELTVELNIHLNSYYLNLRGALDNLASVLALEWGLRPQTERRGRVQYFADLFREDFQSALEIEHPSLVRRLRKLNRWRSEIKEFRDPAAHRTPLYVAPGIHTDDNKERRESLQNAASEAIEKKEFSKYTSLQNEIRNLAEYRPAFLRSQKGGFEFHWLTGQLQRDQRVFLWIVWIVLRELFGPLSLTYYQQWLASRRHRSPSSFERLYG